MVLRAQDGQLRQRFAQDARENRADGVFRLKVSRVEEVQAAVLRFFKVIVFEIRGHERVAARGEDFVNRAAAAAAADNTITDSSTVIISLFTFIYCLLFFYLLLPRGTGERRLRINNI